MGEGSELGGALVGVAALSAQRVVDHRRVAHQLGDPGLDRAEDVEQHLEPRSVAEEPLDEDVGGRHPGGAQPRAHLG
jgi:hypothetical protein